MYITFPHQLYYLQGSGRSSLNGKFSKYSAQVKWGLCDQVCMGNDCRKGSQIQLMCERKAPEFFLILDVHTHRITSHSYNGLVFALHSLNNVF